MTDSQFSMTKLNSLLCFVFVLLAAHVRGAAFLEGSGSGGAPGTNDFLNGPNSGGYYDDFNRAMILPGVIPAAPSGHIYRMIGNPTTDTNGLFIQNGRWFCQSNGTIYLSISNQIDGVQGSIRRYNKFGGVVRFERGYLPDGSPSVADGVIRGLGFHLSSNANFVGGSPLFLHGGLGPNSISFARELSATNFISEALPGGTYLIYGTNYSWSMCIVSNTITAEFGGYRFQRTDPAIGLYANFPVITLQSVGNPTNQFFGKWDSVWAHYTTPEENAVFGAGGILPGTTNFAVAGLRLEEGPSNARFGRVGLASGLATVSTTAVNANSRFILSTIATNNPVSAVCVTNIVNGTSFQIRSASGSDGNSVDWQIVDRFP